MQRNICLVTSGIPNAGPYDIIISLTWYFGKTWGKRLCN